MNLTKMTWWRLEVRVQARDLSIRENLRMIHKEAGVKLRRKVALNVNGLPAQTVIISYTTYHPDHELHTITEKEEYERRTGKCSNKAHLDTHEIYLDVVDLSRLTKDASTKYSNWYDVKTVNVYVDAAFVTYNALNGKNERTMSHIIPLLNILKVDVHYKRPRIQKSKTQQQSESKNISDLDDAEKVALK